MEETSTTSSSRTDRESSKADRPSARKPTVDETAGGGSGRDSRSSLSQKDYNRGELRSGAQVEGGDRKGEDGKESKRRSEKPTTPQPAVEAERPSSVCTRSPSPVKRKPVPEEDVPLLHEPPRTLIIDPEDDSMGSPMSSFEEIDSDIEAIRKDMIGQSPAPPRPHSPELEAELNLAIAKAEQDKKREEERDFAIAKRLDQELNAADPRSVPGDFPDAATVQPSARGSTRSSGGGGGGFFSSSASDRATVEKLKDKLASYKRRYDDAEKLASQWQQRAREHHAQANRFYQDAKYLQMEVSAAQKHVAHLDGELKSAKHELGAVKQQLSDAVNLSEVRGKELKGAQVFLTKADTLSVSDVVQKVAALNEEIFQMAAFLGEVLIYEVLEEGADREETRQHAVSTGYKQAEKLLGEILANALAQESMHEPKEPSNPLLVQIVMQIGLTQWCASLGSRWTSYHKVERGEGGEGKQGEGNSSARKQVEYDNMLRDLYDSIRDNEEQAVAGRWRSLTRAHLPFSANGWDHTLMLGIVSIMGVAGWATRTHDEMEQIEKRLASIFKPLLELRKATGEDVTSADLEIAIVDPRASFDPRYMEDEYADGRNARGSNTAPEAVVSTSGMGLKRMSVRKMKEGGVQRVVEMLALPKVVLERTVKEALEPPAPAKKKKKVGGEGAPGLLSSMMGF